eukprot:scaffold570659_cov23-Prasinocladus_malaysianus.AAC.1
MVGIAGQQEEQVGGGRTPLWHDTVPDSAPIDKQATTFMYYHSHCQSNRGSLPWMASARPSDDHRL